MIKELFHAWGAEVIFGAAVLGAIAALCTAGVKAFRLLRKFVDKLDLLDDLPAMKKSLESLAKDGVSLKEEFTHHRNDTQKFRRNMSGKLRVMDNTIQEIKEQTRGK